ncbi:hypothetical protein FACS1894152_0710 [Bacilli bacterium]|nr:hypothetical protein FACS1894152_0710 [Bacilli bacterium]
MKERHFTFTLNVQIPYELTGSKTAAYDWIRKFCIKKDFELKGDSDYICLH